MRKKEKRRIFLLPPSPYVCTCVRAGEKKEKREKEREYGRRVREIFIILISKTSLKFLENPENKILIKINIIKSIFLGNQYH